MTAEAQRFEKERVQCWVHRSRSREETVSNAFGPGRTRLWRENFGWHHDDYVVIVVSTPGVWQRTHSTDILLKYMGSTCRKAPKQSPSFEGR